MTVLTSSATGRSIALLMSCVLAACGGGGGTSGSGGSAVAPAPTPAPSPTPAPPPPPPAPAPPGPTPAAVAPTAPQDLAATDGANAVALGFSPPADAGSSAIQRYTASCSDGVHRFVGSASASPVVVSGLVQSTPYSCVVSASNAELDGPATSPVSVTLPAPAAFTGHASAPLSVSAVAGNASLTLAFSTPTSDGSFPIMGYHATCTGQADGYALASPIIVGGLRNGNAVSCTVAAVNAQGEGASSASVTATPSASSAGAVPPSAPTAVSATALNGALRIDLAAPTSDGGSTVIGYTAVCNAGGLDASGSAAASPIRVSGLGNGRAYVCRVTARNAFGSSVAVTTAAVTPSASTANPVDPAAVVSLGVVNPSIAADGLTAVVAQLRTATGALYEGGDIAVSFSSSCAHAGTAQIDTSAVAHAGTAVATYQPAGCTGADVITATAAGLPTASTTLIVGQASALSAKAALGRQLFLDKALSAGGNVACASCHAPGNNFLAPNANSTQSGGVNGTVAGFRSSPSATYAALATPFRFLSLTNQQGTVDNGANGKLGTPRGGLMWDGRASDVRVQAQGPFTGPHEMANASSAAVLAKLLARPYLADFQSIYGTTNSGSDANAVLANMADAIAQFETEDRAFMPFNSKYDAVQAGTATFSSQEANGQLMFFMSNKGACAGCHTPFSQARAAQSPATFSDGAYRAIGVPRNWRLPYNVDSTASSALSAIGLSGFLDGAGLGAPNHAFYDLGFCGPMRTDSLLDASLCGVFRTPDLRNVAIKGSYFHNGVFGDLQQVLDFYLNRESNPAAVYLAADGSPDIPYNDLPVQFDANVAQRAPFTPVAGGRLSPAEQQDLIAFLCTLTDGYDPANPGGYRQPAQCSRATRRP